MKSKLERISAITAELLNELGVPEDQRGELADTPGRVARAWLEKVDGYGQRAEDVIGDLFEMSGPMAQRTLQSSMVQTLRPISFSSTCMQHMLPFFGVAKIAYVPACREDGSRAVIGLSKLARLVTVYAKRLTMQERIAEQTALAILEHGKAAGALVIMICRHTCLCSRGINQRSPEASTLYAVGTLAAGHPLHVSAVKMLDPTPRSAV